MDVGFGTFEEEKAVVVDEFFAAVEVHKGGYFAAFFVVEELCFDFPSVRRDFIWRV